MVVSGVGGGSGGDGDGGGGGGDSSPPSFSTILVPPETVEESSKEINPESKQKAKELVPAGTIKKEEMPAGHVTVTKPNDDDVNLVTIKEEEEEEEEGEDEQEEECRRTLDEINGAAGSCFNAVNGSPSSSSSVVLHPKPMEGLHESGPPPFLKKTFEMVESTETDDVVSWSKGKDSFIVWDSHEFSKNLLPKYFKHSNFSSFIRQLNTYGFRKIDPDRWEFANEGFQGGKKHLLKNIKRRSRYNKQQHGGALSAADSTNPILEAEVECLKKDEDVLRVEILKLKQQQEDSQNSLRAFTERVQVAECKLRQMFIFFVKALKNPIIIEHLIQKRKQLGELDGREFRKKQRLLPTQDPESLPDGLDTCQSVNCRNQAQEQLATMQTELARILPDGVETSLISKLFMAPTCKEFCDPIDQDNKVNMMRGTDTLDMSAVYDEMSEKLLDESSVIGNSVVEDLDVNDSKFYLELEDLIGKPRACCGYVTGLVEHTGCIG